jgi:hypothetical protein
MVDVNVRHRIGKVRTGQDSKKKRASSYYGHGGPCCTVMRCTLLNTYPDTMVNRVADTS